MPFRSPIAIIGIGCRLPGAVSSPRELKQFLQQKRSGIVPVPSDRWDAATFYHPDFAKPGRIHSTRGGFIENIESFDAGFFGISVPEADRMDPQQRLILETSFRAIEDAGVRLEQLAGTRTAVFVGASSQDYGAIQLATRQRERIASATNTGWAFSILSNRVSYLFDLRGPSCTVDTACSSALTAVHLACRAIWDGTAEAALVGGVNVLLGPEATLGFSKGNYLSPDGECRAFSDDANGYVRSEGCGVILLKPLATALADSNRIYAMIRGTWMNQDGRTQGMTNPSREAQEALLESAYRDAQVDPSRVCYVEAHGTGTPVGDPVEAAAIGRVVGRNRSEADVCYIGSIKTNIGHLESAAGIAGLIKLALTLQSGLVFPNRNFRAPNPEIPFGPLHLQVPTEVLDFPYRPLFAGVNGFGFGGANAHVVLESPPSECDSVPSSPLRNTGDQIQTLLLSARSKSALQTSAQQLASALERAPANTADIGAELASHRSRFEHRVAVQGAGPDQLVRELRRFSQIGEVSESTMYKRVADEAPAQIGFIFSGQGPQWWGMGRSLLRQNPTFREALSEIQAELSRLGWLGGDKRSLFDELEKAQNASRMTETCVAQPTIFALQVGVVAVLRELGVSPSAVLGHSIGELAAAVTAGCLTVAEGTRIVFCRSHSQATLEGRGLMAAVGLAEEEIRLLLADYDGQVEVAAINGPQSVTVAGTGAAIERLVRDCEQRKAFVRQLGVHVPFHCFVMDPIEKVFRRRLGDVAPGPGRIPFYSSVTGKSLSGDNLTSEYWWQNIRQPVRFYPAFNEMLTAGITHFIEIGPHPIHKRDAEAAAGRRSVTATVLPSLNRNDTDDINISRLLQQLWTLGFPCIPVRNAGGGVEMTPTYPFERKAYWNESASYREARRTPSRPHHPHIEASRASSKSPHIFSVDVTFDQHAEAYLADHVVQGVLVVPGAALLDLIVCAASVASDAKLGWQHALEDVEFRRAISLPERAHLEDEAELQLDLYSEDGSFRLASRRRNEPGAGWLEHTRGRVNRLDGHRSFPALSFSELSRRITTSVPIVSLFESLASLGLELGPSFRGMIGCWTDGQQMLSRIQLPSCSTHDVTRFGFHPGIMDSIVQTAGLAGWIRKLSPTPTLENALFLPARAGRFELYGQPDGEAFWCHGVLERKTGHEFQVSAWAFRDNGEPLVALEHLVLQAVPGSRAHRTGREDELFRHAWQQEVPGDSETAVIGGRWLVLANGPDCQVSCAVIPFLAEQGAEVIVCRQGAAFLELSKNDFQLCPDESTDVELLLKAIGTESEIRGIVHLWSCPAARGEGEIETAAVAGPIAMASLIRCLDEASLWGTRSGRIIVITTGAQAVEPVDVGQIHPPSALLAGFARVLMSERPHLDVELFDLSRSPSPSELRRLLAEICREASQREMAIRDTHSYVKILRTQDSEARCRTIDVDVAKTPIAAKIQTIGHLDSIAFEAQFPREPAPREVEILVKSCSLNFKDLAITTGLIPGETFSKGHTQDHLGMDCAGVVVRIGKDVQTLRPGDSVMAFAPRSIATRVWADARHVVRIPHGLSSGEAAAIPMAFLTAKLALEWLARLAPLEVVLIHTASGGVGLAAVQVAHQLGGTVIATAGNPAKAEFLKSWGVKHVFNSRTTDFRDKVLEVTGGRGADVVINSLSGDALLQGIRSLAPFGRFIELGKADLVEQRQLPMRLLAENRSYLFLDADQWLAARPAEVQKILAECAADLERGRLRPLPITRFPLERTTDAFRYLATAQHVGKVVIDVPQAGTIRANFSLTRHLEGEGWYVVSGGTRGYGLSTAKWLIERGARKVALLGRSGALDPADLELLNAIRRADVAIDIRRCDVGDLAEVRGVCAELRTSAPIRGVVHAATVLDDAPIAALDHERFMRVIRPKAVGAWNLHVATQSDDLQVFLMFSSVSAVFGTPGQANYAAANAYLDSLVHYLRSRRVAAFAVNWGVLDDVGLVARASADRRRKILNQGIRGFGQQEVFRLLETILDGDSSSILAARIDWDAGQSEWFADRFPGIRSTAAASDLSPVGQSLRDRLHATPAENREGNLATAIFHFASKLTGASDQETDIDIRLDRMGIDSLNAVQLAAWVEQEVGAAVTIVKLMQGPSPRELAQHILAQAEIQDQDSLKFEGPEESPSLKCRRHVAKPAWRMFCHPYFGGTGKIYDGLAQDLPADVELWSLELPESVGPEGAKLELPAEETYDWLAAKLRPLTDLPYVIYGHSYGCSVAIQVARHLWRDCASKAELLALGAMPAPPLMAKLKLDASYDNPRDIPDEFIRAAMHTLGIPHLSSSNALLMSRIRRDVWFGSRSNFEQVHLPTGVPVLIFGGTDDPLETIDKNLAAYIGQVDSVDLRHVRGGHLFLDHNSSRAEVVGELCLRVNAKLIGRQNGPPTTETR